MLAKSPPSDNGSESPQSSTQPQPLPNIQLKLGGDTSVDVRADADEPTSRYAQITEIVDEG